MDKEKNKEGKMDKFLATFKPYFRNNEEYKEFIHFVTTHSKFVTDSSLENNKTWREVWFVWINLWTDLENNTKLIIPLAQAETRKFPRAIKLKRRPEEHVSIYYTDVDTPTVTTFSDDDSKQLIDILSDFGIKAGMHWGELVRYLLYNLLKGKYVLDVESMNETDLRLYFPIKFGDDAFKEMSVTEFEYTDNMEVLYVGYYIYWTGMKNLSYQDDPFWFNYVLDSNYIMNFERDNDKIVISMTYTSIETTLKATDRDLITYMLQRYKVKFTHAKKSKKWRLHNITPSVVRILCMYFIERFSTQFSTTQTEGLAIIRPRRIVDLPRDIRTYIATMDVQAMLSAARMDLRLSEALRMDNIWTYIYKRDFPDDFSWIKGECPIFVQNKLYRSEGPRNEPPWKTLYLCTRRMYRQWEGTEFEKPNAMQEHHDRQLFWQINILLYTHILDVNRYNDIGTTNGSNREVIALFCTYMDIDVYYLRQKYMVRAAVEYMNNYRATHLNATNADIFLQLKVAEEMKEASVMWTHVWAEYNSRPKEKDSLLGFMCYYVYEPQNRLILPDKMPVQWITQFSGLVDRFENPQKRIQYKSWFASILDSYNHPVCAFNFAAFDVNHQGGPRTTFIYPFALFINSQIIRNSVRTHEFNVFMQNIADFKEYVTDPIQMHPGAVMTEWKRQALDVCGVYDSVLNLIDPNGEFPRLMVTLKNMIPYFSDVDDPNALIGTFTSYAEDLLEYFAAAPRSDTGLLITEEIN